MPDSDGPRRGEGSVRARVVGGALLNFGGMMVIRLLGIVNVAILARLLSPGDFGLVALATIAVGFTEALINKQFEMALMRHRDAGPSHFDTAFTLGLILGLSGAVLIFLAADWAAAFFDAPALAPVLRWLSLVPLLMGLRNPYFVRFEMALDFRPRVMRNTSSRLVLSVVSIAVALIWRNHWALVAGLIAMHATFAAMTWRHRFGRPRLGLVNWREFVEFGGWLTGAGVATFLQKRIPVGILGRMEGTHAAGLFQVGNEIATTMTQQLLNPVGGALYPGLVSVASDRQRLRQGYLYAQQGLLGIALPIGIGMAVAAPDIVRVLLGTQWAAAVPVIAIVTPISALLTLSLGVRAVAMIDGDTRALFLRNLVVLALVVPLALAGQMLYGMIGLVLGESLAMLANLAMTLAIASRATGTRLLEPFAWAWRSFAAVGVMAGMLVAHDLATGFDPFETSFGAAAVVLALKVLAGALSVMAVQALLWHVAGRPEGFERQIVNVAQRGLARVRRRKGGKP